MNTFEDLHHDRIVGSLAMFDRMIFKGHLTQLFHPEAVSAFLWAQGFPMKEFTRYAQSTTERITANAKALAAKTGRPYIYLDHAKTRSRPRTKEDMAPGHWPMTRTREGPSSAGWSSKSSKESGLRCAPKRLDLATDASRLTPGIVR